MATLKEQIEDERKKQKALVVQMEGEAALAESLNRSFDMHAGGLMKVEVSTSLFVSIRLLRVFLLRKKYLILAC
jgi:hypothetical protein